MAAVVIQINDRYQKFELAESIVERELTIGRGFANDLIVTDPYVALSQLTLSRSSDNEHNWHIHNMDRTNPLLVNRRVIESPDFDIRSGDEISIGRTKLIFFTEDHALPEIREFSFTNWLHNHKFRPLFAGTVLFSLFLVTLAMAYLTTSSEVKWAKLAAEAISPVALAIIWASGWSLTGRFLKSDQYFFSHLFFTGLCFSLLIILGDVYSYFDYVFSSEKLGELIDWLLTILMFGLLFGLNLTLVTNTPGTFKKGLIASAGIFGVVAALMYLYQEEYANTPLHTSTFKPSFIPTTSPESIGEYVDGYSTLFDNLSSVD